MLRLLDARLDQPENFTVQSKTHGSALLVRLLPNGIFYSVSMALYPDEASETRRDSLKGQV